jgi:hypothetical protein
VLIHFIAPHGKLYHSLLTLEQVLGSIPPLISEQQLPGPCEPHHAIPLEERPNVARRVIENPESLRQVEEPPEYFATDSPALSLLLHAPPWLLLFDISGLRTGFLQHIGVMNIFHAPLPM